MILSVAEFVELRTSEDPEMNKRAAQEEAPAEVWAEVIKLRPDLRFWVAQNKTVTLEILSILATDGDSRVRSMVARKRKVPASLLELMSTDSTDAVRMAVARNRNTSTEVLKNLARADPWAEVRAVASKRVTSG